MKVMDVLVEIPGGDETDGLVTVDDVLRLAPNRKYRFELHEGVLRMMPPPAWRHQKIASRLERYFEDAGRSVCQGNGIKFNSHNYRIPDVLVLKHGVAVDEDSSVHPPDLFEIVVEVVSPGTVDEDRLLKSKIYASAGIPEYWLVERRPDGYVVLLGRLRDGGYAWDREVALEELLAGGGGLV
ncbi:Uma2 family endonuclease [Dactylosporangium sp. NPDC050588]|uniref:Uma2 family endonuclease n=1 Tax=Dactylosporangium sp. NPDC050588 TaxID=3157211 RepID=UPI0033F98297